AGAGSERLKSLAEGMSRKLEEYRGSKYAFGQSSYLSYLVNGDTTDWAYGVHGIPAYTVELPPQTDQGGGFFNAESEILPIFLENLGAALYLIEDCIAVYVPPGPEERDEGRSKEKGSDGERVGR
ncbi:MAG: zinc carboxypeptidase, partial [Candidatus Aminicenantes bacterium]|nr:zinc carboxypeptidase [Candidatus Aminicenantes bacterium]